MDFKIHYQDGAKSLEESLFLDSDRIEYLDHRIKCAVHDFQRPLKKDEKREPSILIKQILALAENTQELAYVAIQVGNIMSQMKNRNPMKGIIEMLMGGRPPEED